MENEKLTVELKYLRIKKKYLLKQKDKLEDVVSASDNLISLGIRPIPKLEPHLLEERKKQWGDFEQRVKDLKVTWSSDVLEMIEPIKEEYPLLEFNEMRDIAQIHLIRLRDSEELCIEYRYRQLILENIATVKDISCLNYDDFKDAVDNKPNFSDEDFKTIFECACQSVTEIIYFLMADKACGTNLEEELITEDMKKYITDP